MDLDYPTHNNGTTHDRPAWNPPTTHDPETCEVCRPVLDAGARMIASHGSIPAAYAARTLTS